MTKIYKTLTKINLLVFYKTFLCNQSTKFKMFSTMPHISNAQDALASIEAMRMQEENGYKTEDYMSQAQPEVRSCRGPQQQQVDRECRSKMSEWCFQVVDFCKFNRDTVAIAMSYLDRFLMTPSGSEALKDRKIFQLAAMTCLYTAIKIHEPEAMEPKVVASLSRGAYTEDEVTYMERQILIAIQWRMNPPTAMSFVHHFMCLMPAGAMTENEREATIEVAKFQTELAVNSYAFVGVNASTVAFAALTNSLQCSESNRSVEFELLTAMSKAANIKGDCYEMVNVQDTLYEAVQNASTGPSDSGLRSTTVSKTMKSNMGSSSRSIHTSPRSVSTEELNAYR